MSNVRVRHLSGVRAVSATPSDEDLVLIAECAGQPVVAEQIHVRQMRLAHNQYDTTGERFPKAYLDRFSDSIPGKAAMCGHDYRDLPLGRFFRARTVQRMEHGFPMLVRDEEGKAASLHFEPQDLRVIWTEPGFYFPADADGEAMRQRIDLGVYRDVSIGFRFDDLDCDICRKSYFSDCPHIIGWPDRDGVLVTGTYSGDPKRAEALEGSLVWLGAQQQARLVKAVRDGSVDPHALAQTAYGEDLVMLKEAEGYARRYGHAVKSWSFPALAEKGATSFRDLPLADRERAWDASAADRRVRAWADAEEAPNARYRRAFFWYDAEAPDQFGSYKLQFADVVDGDLRAVPRGVFAVAAVLQGARGGVDIPDADVPGVKRHVERYYAKMRREFDDDSLVPPWEREGEDNAPVGAHTDPAVAGEAEEPSVGGKSEEAPVGADREVDMTAEELAALEQRAVDAEQVLAAERARAEQAEAEVIVLRTDAEAQKALAGIGGQALQDLQQQILDDYHRLTGQDSAELSDLVKLHVERNNYARLKELAAEKRAAVLAKFPTQLSADPVPVVVVGRPQDFQLV